MYRFLHFFTAQVESGDVHPHFSIFGDLSMEGGRITFVLIKCALPLTIFCSHAHSHYLLKDRHRPKVEKRDSLRKMKCDTYELGAAYLRMRLCPIYHPTY